MACIALNFLAISSMQQTETKRILINRTQQMIDD